MFSKFLFSVSILIALSFSANAQTAPQLYSKAYGDPAKPAIIFLHGGPGQNSIFFEESTAEGLANKGFYVIVYDQRGCGRSLKQGQPEFTIEEAINDLQTIINTYHVKKPMLLGHHFGGSVGIFYTNKYPDSISKLILVSTPLHYRQWMHTAIDNTKQDMRIRDDMQYYQMMDKVDKGDTTSSAFYINLHSIADLAGVYLPKKESDTAKAIRKKIIYGKNADHAEDFDVWAVKGFTVNERYHMIIFNEPLLKISKKVPVYGIYGWEDKTFDGTQLKEIQKVIPKTRLNYILKSGHYPYLDRNIDFIQTVTQMANEKKIVQKIQPVVKPIPKKSAPKKVK